MESAAIVEAYYRAMGRKDLKGMEKYLHPNVQFISPLAAISKKEVVLEAAKQLFSNFNTLNLRECFGASEKAMVIYDLDCPPPMGIFRVAGLMTLKDNLIVRIELFYDGRPFEKKKDEIFAKQ